jgi:WD40 repeat protein
VIHFVQSLFSLSIPTEQNANGKNAPMPMLSITNESSQDSNAVESGEGGQLVLARAEADAKKNVAASISSQALVARQQLHHAKVPTPQWHANWELSAVISGHLGWVRSIAFDPTNEWFATGSVDRTIKVIVVFQ